MKLILNLIIFCLAIQTVAAQAQRKYTVSGHIVDDSSSETIIGATVIIAGTSTGTVSNSFGFYSLTIPQGKVTLSYSYVSFGRVEKTINLTSDTVINIRLHSEASLNEVTVRAKRTDIGVQSTAMGSLDVPLTLIEHTPALLGETDVIRTVALTPGVQQGSLGSAFFVRGGTDDENLVLLDGSPIYKVDHLFGFFSVFTPEAVKKVSFYKSSFPARYNGRTSSVLDIRTKDGDMQNYHASVSLGLLTSRFNVEGPIVRDRTSFSLSARTTYIGIFTRAFSPDEAKFSYWFYDLNAKINHKFSDNDRLYAGLYNGRDRYFDKYADDYTAYSDYIPGGNGENGGMYTVNEEYGSHLSWGNTLGTLRWNHIFTGDLFANTTVSYNHYRMNIDNSSKTSSYMGYNDINSECGSEIIDYNAATDFDFHPLPQHAVKYGANYIYHNFKPQTSTAREKSKYNNDVAGIDTSLTTIANTIYAHELSVYAEDNIQLGERLSICPSVAWTLFKVQQRTYQNWQPRLSARLAISDDWAAKASYTRMTQCVHMLTSSIIAMPTDLWVPITKDIEPETADQISFGGYYTGFSGWELSAEVYYKEQHNVLEYKDGMSYMGFTASWDNMVAMGRGYNRGIEFMARRDVGRATGWITYTLAKSDRKFSRESGVNDGQRFPFTYDRRHCINLVASYALNDKWTIDASWQFASGARATISTSMEDLPAPDDDYFRSVYSYIPMRNNYRLPPHHLLCLSVNNTKKWRYFERTWNFSLYNAYNAMNSSFVFVTHEDDDGNMYNKPKLTKLTVLPIIPSITFTLKY